MTYQIPPGILSFCHGFWNEQTKQFDTGTSQQVVQCCLNSCLKHVNYCFEICPNCSKCYELKQSCENGCLEYDTKQDIPVYTQDRKIIKKQFNYNLIIIAILIFLFMIKLKFY